MTGTGAGEARIGEWRSEDGLTLRYREYAGPAARPPVLCLHGLTRNSRDFEPLCQHLAGRWRVIAPDMRGRGMSDRATDADSYVLPRYVADVAALREQAGIGRYVAVGTSMGGLMTLLQAASDPSVLAGVVLNDIGPVLEPEGLGAISGYLGKPRRFASWAEAGTALAEEHGATHPAFGPAQWEAMARRVMVEDEAGGIVFDYDMAIAQPFARPGNAAPPDLWPMFHALRSIPTLLLRGGSSRLLSADTFSRMAEALPDAATVTVPGVGHAPTLEEPEAVAAIDALLARVAAG